MIHSLLQQKVIDCEPPAGGDKSMSENIRAVVDGLRQSFYDKQQSEIEKAVENLSERKKAELGKIRHVKAQSFRACSRGRQ